jgi:hypothetical protein
MTLQTVAFFYCVTVAFFDICFGLVRDLLLPCFGHVANLRNMTKTSPEHGSNKSITKHERNPFPFAPLFCRRQLDLFVLKSCRIVASVQQEHSL